MMGTVQSVLLIWTALLALLVGYVAHLWNTNPVDELPFFFSKEEQWSATRAATRTPMDFGALISSQHEKHDEDGIVGDVKAKALGLYPPKRKKLNPPQVSIVVNHCDKELFWLKDFLVNITYTNLTIISKCGYAVVGNPSYRARLMRLPNIGRCDHTFAYWIRRLVTTPEPTMGLHSDHVVMFLKDNAYQTRDYHTAEEMVEIAHHEGFACALKPFCALPCADVYQATVFHDTSVQQEFYLQQHNRVERDDSSGFKSDYQDLRDWRERAIGLMLPDDVPTPVCYGGAFAVRADRFLSSRPLELWQRLEQSLSRGNNIEEGHFAERSWAAMLLPPLSRHMIRPFHDLVVQRVSRQLCLSPEFGVQSMCGMLLLPIEGDAANDVFTLEEHEILY